MKKLCLCCLIISGLASGLLAQNRTFYDIPFNRSEATFNYPKIGMGKAHFSFWGILKAGNGTMIIDLNNIKHLKYLPNLDSLVKAIKPNLQPMLDSFKNDAFNRRIDYLTGGLNPQIRIVNHDNAPQQFVIKEGVMNELKTTQDTIRIKAFIQVSKEDVSLYYDTRYNASNKPEMQPFYLTLVFNNASELYSLPENSLQNCMNKLQQEWGVDYVSNANPKAGYSAAFNMATGKMFSPGKVKWIKNPGQVPELVPNIYAGLQFAKGVFVPSFSAGIRYTLANRTHSTTRFYAMWEPHFFFSKDLLNNVITERNDFLTLRCIDVENKHAPFDIVGNVSIGYLISRKGNWFEPNTYKVGIPGVRSGWLQLEPEFFFHGFLKGVSPSIKLTIHYE
jgi:hypothetical protein